MPRRFLVRSAKSAKVELLLTGDSLAQTIQKKNRNLRGVQVQMTDWELGLKAEAVIGPWSVPVAVAGRVQLDGNRLQFLPDAATIGPFPAPSFLLFYAEKRMNPVLDIDLSAWYLKPLALRLSPHPVNAIVLTFDALN